MTSCDHSSVGILVWHDNKLLLIERKFFPYGFAPPSGHCDGDSFDEAAKRELKEEVGLETADLKLLLEDKVENNCKRPGGSWHDWKVYEAKASGEIAPSKNETKQVGWYSIEQIKNLAEKTNSYLKKRLTEEEWESSPGLETVWYDFFKKLKLYEGKR
jgi:ADP-ribose pyrophosphatase YjhB (NUDIX family)